MPTLVFRHPVPGDRLHDEVNVAGIQMRPQRDVDLVRALKFGDNRGRFLQQGAELNRLISGEIGDMHDVAFRFHDQRAHAERSDAVVDKPQPGLVDAPARRGFIDDRLARRAVAHRRNVPPRARS